MCRCDGAVSYSAYPAGHVFRLGVAILILTANSVVVRVCATVALLNIKDSQAFCRATPQACAVTALSVVGSTLPPVAAAVTGAFAIAAAKRSRRFAFVVAFASGCFAMSASFVLLLVTNGIRHGFNIDAVLVPDIVEIILYCVLNLLTMIVGIVCVKALFKDPASRYAVDDLQQQQQQQQQPSTSGASASAGYDNFATDWNARGIAEQEEDEDDDDEDDDGKYDNFGAEWSGRDVQDEDEEDEEDVSSGNHLRVPVASASASVQRSNSATRRVGVQMTFVVEDESGAVTDYGIFNVARKKRRRAAR